MKTTGIALVLLLLLVGLSILYDYWGGSSDIQEALRNTLNPLYVMDPVELVVFALVLLGLVVTPVRLFLRQKGTKANNRKNGQ